MTYFTYWGLRQAPFDNVPDPTMYWSQNPSLEDAISEVLFAIQEGNECLAVVVGDIGTGKTLALRVLLDELSEEKYKVAFLTNPTLTFTQIMREIIGQLENKKVSTKWKDHLQEEFNQLLYRSADEGKRVVVFIDEANVLSPSSLQGLRLLTNIQDNDRNLITFVLAGQKELARKLERPSMENLYQRIGVYCKVTGLDSQAMVAGYISHRLKQAGCTREVFADPARRARWKYSRGVPRMVNRICKLCLKAGETNQLQTIDKTMVDNLAHMFEKGFFKKKEATSKREAREAAAIEVKREGKASETVPPKEEEGSNLASFGASIQPVAAPSGDDAPYPRLSGAEPSLPAGDGKEAAVPSESEAIEKAQVKEFDVVENGGKPEAEVATDGQAFGEEKDTLPATEEIVKRIPPDILNRLCFMEDRQLYRLAGQLAADQLRENEDLRNSGDPILHWEKMRSELMILLKELSAIRHVRQTSQYR